jgi:hypothetical protein
MSSTKHEQSAAFALSSFAREVIQGPASDTFCNRRASLIYRATTTVSISAQVAHEFSIEAICFHLRTVDWNGTVGVSVCGLSLPTSRFAPLRRTNSE